MIYSLDENSIMMKALDTSDASVKDRTSEIRKSSPVFPIPIPIFLHEAYVSLSPFLGDAIDFLPSSVAFVLCFWGKTFTAMLLLAEGKKIWLEKVKTGGRLIQET